MTVRGGEQSVELHDTWLRVQLPSSGQPADFHYLWLRHFSSTGRNSLTRELQTHASDLSASITARAARWNERGALEVVWEPDGLVSEYEPEWLGRYAYATSRPSVPPPPATLGEVTLELDEAGEIGAVVARAVELLAEHGVVFVRAQSAEAAQPEFTEAWIEAMAQQGWRTTATHFGRIEDLRPDNTTNSNNDQLGYTNEAVDVHTDQPFLQTPPRLQLLHCVQAAAQGGDSVVVDAEAAARYLADTDAEAYRLLTTIPVTFHRQQKAFEAVVEAPILGATADGRFQVRASYFTMAPPRVPFAQIQAWYRAWTTFERLVRHPAHQRRMKLMPGDAVIYDNHRMLHARTAFAGGRWMRGVYFDR
jgi:alpha-ketoglutarate-dependent taurine dioxygenase